MSVGQYWEAKADVPDCRFHVIDFTGNGSGTPTVNQATGVTLTRSATGDYKATFKDNPGKFVGLVADSFRSTTATDLAGFTAVAKTWDATNRVLEFLVFNSSFAAADLSSAQSLTIVAMFRPSSVPSV